MAYPEKLLADDEQVVKHLHPNWITIAPGDLWFIVLCAGAGVGIAYAPDHGTGRTVVLIIIAVVWLVLVSWLVHPAVRSPGAPRTTCSQRIAC